MQRLLGTPIAATSSTTNATSVWVEERKKERIPVDGKRKKGKRERHAVDG
jgi:hypothetical protein